MVGQIDKSAITWPPASNLFMPPKAHLQLSALALWAILDDDDEGERERERVRELGGQQYLARRTSLEMLYQHGLFLAAFGPSRFD